MSKDSEQNIVRRGIDGVLEASKTVDKVVLPASGFLYLAGYPPAGAIFIISAVTYVAADHAQKPTE